MKLILIYLVLTWRSSAELIPADIMIIKEPPIYTKRSSIQPTTAAAAAVSVTATAMVKAT